MNTTLYRIGGVAALLAGILLRRNLGVEIAIFSPQKPPDTVAGWFALLQSSRLLGLAYLNIFDIANCVLVALMLLALYAALKAVSPGYMAIALSLGLLGIGVYLATNTALSLLALSHQYTAADEAHKTLLLAAGEALLALNRFSSAGAQPGSGGYLSLLLIAAAGLITSLVMLRSTVFGQATAWIGIAAAALDLAYCLAYPLAPAATAALLAVLFIPAAGLLLMVWHILVGWRLLRLGSQR